MNDQLTTFMSSLKSLSDLFAVPVLAYVLGRLTEQGLRAIYTRLRPDLSFRHSTEGDAATLAVSTRNPIYLDEVQVHLSDRVIDVVGDLMKKLDLSTKRRIQMNPLDRLVFESIIQPEGDRLLHIHSYVGNNSITMENAIKTTARSAVQFMRNTEITIQTPRKSYRRFLFSRCIDGLARLTDQNVS